MSRYDDPSWYEEQETNPPQLEQFMDDDFHVPSVMPMYASQYPQSMPPSEDRQHLRRFLRQAVVIASLLVIAFLGGWFSHQYFGNTFNQSDQSRTYAQLFQQAWVTIDQNYVDRKAINYKQMSYRAIQAMVDSLNDRGHTRFSAHSRFKQRMSS